MVTGTAELRFPVHHAAISHGGFGWVVGVDWGAVDVDQLVLHGGAMEHYPRHRVAFGRFLPGDDHASHPVWLVPAECALAEFLHRNLRGGLPGCVVIRNGSRTPRDCPVEPNVEATLKHRLSKNDS